MTTFSEDYTKAAMLLKTQSILLIVFGAIGVLFGILLSLLFLFASASTYDQAESIMLFIYGILTPLFMIIPHIYFIVAGVILLRNPAPKLAKVLSIINIVLGAMWNLVILIFAVLYIAQSASYEKEYKKASQ